MPVPKLFATSLLCASLTGLIASPLYAADPLPPSINVAGSNRFTLNLEEVELKTLITMISEMTGKNFIVDPRVKGKVTVISPRSLTAAETYEVFLSVLAVHGFAAIPDQNVIKVVPETNAKQSAIPTVDGGEPIQLDQYVTRVMEIKYVSAAQMVPILRPLLPQQAHLSAYPATNMLIISDVAGNIDRVMDIISTIDVASASEFEVVPIINAPAEEIAKLLASVKPKSANSRNPEESVTIIAEPRTNSVIISGVETARKELKNLIKQLDIPAGGSDNTKVVYLRYASAKTMATSLTAIAQSLTKVKADPTKPNEVSDVNIQADEVTNSLVISANAKVMGELEAIIRQLDIRRAQVMVKAIIAEISTDRSSEFGVNWGYYGYPDGRPIGLVDFKGALSGVLSAVQSASMPPAFNGLSLAMGDTLGGAGSGYAALVRAIRGDADSNILSTPTLVTLDNQEAEIVVGQSVPFVTGSYTGTTGTTTPSNPFQTIKREDVGLSLKIKPQINEGDSIRLEINQEVSSISTAAVSAADLVTNKRSIKTTVMIDDGQILALGGLIDENLVENKQKVPGLGDIPILGYLFSYNSSQKVKRDLTIFIHPTIIRDSNQGMAISSRKYNALRAEQLRWQEKKLPILDATIPAVPELPEFLELPPPYEEKSAAHAAQPIPAPAKPAINGQPIAVERSEPVTGAAQRGR